MSPQVSVPRRTLPTDSKATPGSCAVEMIHEGGGCDRCVGEQMTVGVLLPFFERADQELFLAGPMPLSSRSRPDRAAASRSSSDAIRSSP